MANMNIKIVKIQKHYFVFVCIIMLTFIFSCKKESKESYFVLKNSSETGLLFQNSLPESADFNILNYLYYYNGGGVSIGDINNDGLDDVFLISNLESNKLFLNKGGLQFEDVTKTANVAGQYDWSTGTNMVDINGDGFLDIYVCNLGDFEGKTGKNELFLNNQDGTFTESAAAFGLDFSTFSTQAYFFDYDRDGDLDMYLLNHAIHTINAYAKRSKIVDVHDAMSGDRFLRNDSEKGIIKFSDVTKASGIQSNPVGFGLAAAVSDVNNDGWSDIYVSNDFHENDYLYINNGDGTFTDKHTEWLGHSSKYSMGNDVGDINNDGLPDIITLDMLPEKPEILQKSMGEDHYALRETILKNGYAYQLSRNTLQLNREGKYSDVAPFMGVEASDWSWSPLFADFDNDGFKDLYITNGIYRRPNDLDYLNYTANSAIQAVIEQKNATISKKLIQSMPQLKIINKMHSNKQGQYFEDVTSQWGMDWSSYSSGVAYSDLDNDGDLDLVVNNINEAVFLIENRHPKDSSNNQFIKIKLHGNAPNTFGIGAKIKVKTLENVIYSEQNTARGFMSSVSPIIHIGLGNVETIEELTVIWPDGTYETHFGLKLSTINELYQKNARGNYYENAKDSNQVPYFSPSKSLISFIHKENTFHDPYAQFLIPKLISREGPGLAVGDVNNDGMEDVYVTGARDQAGQLYIQTDNGFFTATKQDVFENNKTREEVDALFFDADQDGDLDLYAVVAGNERPLGDSDQDQLYLNDGTGNFTPSIAFDGVPGQNSVVTATDFDKDGDIDVFVGGRTKINDYGNSPKSYLFVNQGAGVFKEYNSKDLNYPGMVTDAIWTDINNDTWPDLVLVGEWMPITIFLNNQGQLKQWNTPPGLSNTSGWWNTIIAEDIDNDGDMDMIAGNIGLNTKLKASSNRPVRLYLKDFDNNGQTDPVISHYMEELEVPLAEKDVLTKQMSAIKKKFPDYRSYAGTTISKLFTETELKDAYILEATEFASLIIENLGDGTFKKKQLPAEVNYAPLMTLSTVDVNNDGYKDIIGGGNFLHLTPPLGRQDASFGFVGINDKKGNFTIQKQTESGLLFKGEVRDLEWVQLKSGKKILIVAKNNDAIDMFELN